MSTQAFIVTKGGIIVVETVVSPAAAVSALSNAARQIADDAARMADAWENSKSLNEFVGMAFQGDGLGGFKVIGAAAFGTAAALTAPAWLGLTATTGGAVAISVAAGIAAGKLYEAAFDGVANASWVLSGSLAAQNIQSPIAVATRDFVPAVQPGAFAPDGVTPLGVQQTTQAGPNQRIHSIWIKDGNGNYQKVENVETLQTNGVWRSTILLVGQYNSNGAPVKATQYNFDIAGNTTRTKALVPTAGGSWVDAPAGSPTQALEQVVGQTFTYETTTLAGTANAGMYTATEVTNTETGQVDYIIRHNGTGEAVASGSSYAVNANDTITTTSGGSQFTHGLTNGRLLVMQSADGSGLVVGQNGNDFYFDAGSTVRLNANGGVTVSSPVVAGLHTEITYLAGQFVQAQRIDSAVGGNTVAGYTATSTSSDGVNWSAPVYEFDTPEAASEADHAAWAGLGSGSLSQSDFENIANSSAAYLVNPANTFTPPDFDPYDFGLDPIGAFYDSQSAAYDNAASIADKTLRIVSSTGEALTAAQLAGRDSNADGQLSGIELNGLNAWQDLNEDGLNPTGSELSALSAALASAGVSRIRASDYAFYTQGNGRIGTAAPVDSTSVQRTQPTRAGLPSYSAPARPNPSEPVQASLLSAAPSVNFSISVPASNYRTLRDTDNRYWINGSQWIDFAASLVKMKNSNRPYLISTDGADRFDSSYDDAYPQYFNNSLLTNFLAGGGNDEMGGSTRNDNLWGGTGNDTLDRKMIRRKCHAKQRRLHRAQKTQLFSE